jgi:peptidoglycan/xylan/chitin deacetylase (PgdA/CDA1 family)
VRVALTFDTEHPGHPTAPGVEDRILDTLAEAGFRATFFLQGRWARAYPEAARRIASAGHLIGNHSHHHAPMDSLTEEGFRRDVASAEETIRGVTGVDPKPWFRCPYGSGADDPMLLGRLAELGYRNVGWDVDPEDWAEGRSADEVVSSVLERVGLREDSIVLLHGWPAVTADALPRIVAGLVGSGADVIDVHELLISRR